MLRSECVCDSKAVAYSRGLCLRAALCNFHIFIVRKALESEIIQENQQRRDEVVFCRCSPETGDNQRTKPRKYDPRTLQAVPRNRESSTWCVRVIVEARDRFDAGGRRGKQYARSATNIRGDCDVSRWLINRSCGAVAPLRQHNRSALLSRLLNLIFDTKQIKWLSLLSACHPSARVRRQVSVSRERSSILELEYRNSSFSEFLLQKIHGFQETSEFHSSGSAVRWIFLFWLPL